MFATEVPTFKLFVKRCSNVLCNTAFALHYILNQGRVRSLLIGCHAGRGLKPKTKTCSFFPCVLLKQAALQDLVEKLKVRVNQLDGYWFKSLEV